MAIQADFETHDLWLEQQGEDDHQRINVDDISVIFININDNEVIRKIFNKINKHARKTSTADDIINFVKQHLDSVKAPKMVHITDNLPRSAVGKILRRAAKDLFG